jgi:two-component system sensor histidine kinase KdpD
VLALLPRRTVSLDADQRARLNALCTQVAFALERAQLAREAEVSALRAKTEEMRSSLLSAVSHDCAPLAAIAGAVSTLRDESVQLPDAQRREFAAILKSERLERLVPISRHDRVESIGLRVQRGGSPRELVGSADAWRRMIPGRCVYRCRPAAAAFSRSLLFEQVLVNLLKTRPVHAAGVAIDIEGRVTADGVVEVRDHGPASGPETNSACSKFYHRGANASGRGAGLPDGDCKGIVEAHGGTIDVENRPGEGATFRLRIPHAGGAPSIRLRFAT